MTPLTELLKLHRPRHVKFQQRNFIVARNGGTLYGCLLQAIRETWKYGRGVVYENEKLNSLEDSTPKNGMLTVHRLQITEARISLDNDLDEFWNFYSLASAIYEKLGFDKAPPSEADLERFDEERFEHHALRAIALDCMALGRPSRGTLENVQALPATIRSRVLRRAFGSGKDPQERSRYTDTLIDWFLQYDPGIPEVACEKLPRGEILNLCKSFLSPRPQLSLSVKASIPHQYQSIGVD